MTKFRLGSAACFLAAIAAIGFAPEIVLAQLPAEPGPKATVEVPAAQTTEAGPQPDRDANAQALAEAALASDSAPAVASVPVVQNSERLNALDLFFRGGIFMYPIAVISFLVVAFAIERVIGLRRRRIVPPAFVKGMREILRRPAGFDPRAAMRLCDQYESSASRVFRTVLLRLGRPASELQATVNESCQREAARLYKNVRPISLAVTITPLIGLLGTVQGMIQAFFVTSISPVGINKAQSLAGGIYVALVTTFGGLCVAIPAAVLAHYFEGRIQNLMGRIEELFAEALPQFERYEGKVRAGRTEHPPVSTEPPRVAAESLPRLKRAASSE